MKSWWVGIALLLFFCPLAECQKATQSATQNAQTSTDDSASHDSAFFSQFISLLRRKTPVPPRLPTYFPRVNPKKELHAKITIADDTGYEVILAFRPDCEGQYFCRYGTLIGTTRRFDEIDDLKGRERVAVSLQNGRAGYYYEAVCEGRCNDSLVAWTEGKYQYVVGLKGEEKAYVIEAANSAIADPTAKQQ